MDHRMASYGSKIMSPYSPYSMQNYSFTPSPPKSQGKLYEVDRKIADLNEEIFTKRRHNKEAEIIEGLFSIVGSLAEQQSYAKNKPVTPPPVIQTNNSNNTEMASLISSFQRQQDMMFQFMMNMNQKKDRIKQYKNREIDQSSQMEEKYHDIKKDPEGIKKILAELDFNDDGAENYADKERKFKFSVNLSEEEKAKIIKKIDKEKKTNQVKKDYRLRGIRKFRMVGLIVLFPIYLVSHMLEKRAKFYKENVKNMEEQIEIFKEVTQSWVLKSIKAVLVSTINDPGLDLMMSNKEEDIKSQQINSKIIKLKVRLHGILEGLENATNEINMPSPFRSFFERYTSNKTFIPLKFLTSFEKSRLEFNEFGGLVNQSDDKRRMMLCLFIISRILIGEILLKPVEAGIPVMKGSKTLA